MILSSNRKGNKLTSKQLHWQLLFGHFNGIFHFRTDFQLSE